MGFLFASFVNHAPTFVAERIVTGSAVFRGNSCITFHTPETVDWLVCVIYALPSTMIRVKAGATEEFFALVIGEAVIREKERQRSRYKHEKQLYMRERDREAGTHYEKQL